MSSKIYFSNKSPAKSLLRYIVLLGTGLMDMIAPVFTEKSIRKILVKPDNRPLNPIPPRFIENSIVTEYGDLATFQVGDKAAPIVLFTHGWSGSSAQFYELMEATADKGYHCVAFDHYAHHRSEGLESNFPLFIIGLNNIVEALHKKLQLAGDLHCVVSHSMGVAGTVNVFRDKAVPHFFIAPFFDCMEKFYERVADAGIAKKVVAKIIDGIEIDYKLKVEQLEPDKHIGSILSPICILHDPQDRYAKFQFSQKYANQYDNINLESVVGAGHMRIINALRTQQALHQFLESLAAEANPFEVETPKVSLAEAL